jgi:hypothetical protein
MEMFWIPILAIGGTYATVIVVAILMARVARSRATARAEVQVKLIDKFATAPELVAFLESPAGQQFVDRVQGAPLVATRDRVLSSLRKAIVITALGLGCLAIWIFGRIHGFIYPGFLLLALGAGQGAAAYVSMRLGGPMRDETKATLI